MANSESKIRSGEIDLGSPKSTMQDVPRTAFDTHNGNADSEIKQITVENKVNNLNSAIIAVELALNVCLEGSLITDCQKQISQAMEGEYLSDAVSTPLGSPKDEYLWEKDFDLSADDKENARQYAYAIAQVKKELNAALDPTLEEHDIQEIKDLIDELAGAIDEFTKIFNRATF